MAIVQTLTKLRSHIGGNEWILSKATKKEEDNQKKPKINTITQNQVNKTTESLHQRPTNIISFVLTAE